MTTTTAKQQRPQDVLIRDTNGRKLVVERTPDGVIILGYHPRVPEETVIEIACELGKSVPWVHGALHAIADSGHAVVALDAANADALVDAITWSSNLQASATDAGAFVSDPGPWGA
jgi:hypothetical protein